MPALDQTVAIMLLNGLSGQSAYTSTTTPLKLRLTMNAPTATVAGTAISGGGYTDVTVTFGAPVGTATGALMLNSGSLSWTNSGTAAWTIVGLEIYDSAGTPRRLAWGLWDDSPITVGPGSTFPVAAGGVGWQLP